MTLGSMDTGKLSAAVRVGLLLSLVVALSSCQNDLEWRRANPYTGLTGTQPIDYERRDGARIVCVGPPPKVLEQENNRGNKSDMAVRELGRLVEEKGQAKEQLDQASLRAVAARFPDLEVVSFRLCEHYGNGGLTRTQYTRRQELIPLLQRTIPSTPAQAASPIPST